MAQKTITLKIEVTYDTHYTNAEGVADAVNTLLNTALSTEGILDEIGNPAIGVPVVEKSKKG
jgi:hypothetical protein